MDGKYIDIGKEGQKQGWKQNALLLVQALRPVKYVTWVSVYIRVRVRLAKYIDCVPNHKYIPYFRKKDTYIFFYCSLIYYVKIPHTETKNLSTGADSSTDTFFCCFSSGDCRLWTSSHQGDRVLMAVRRLQVLQSSHQGDHHEIEGSSEFSSRIQSYERPMRGRDLIMWSEGQWKALEKKLHKKGKKSATNKVRNTQTDIATTRPKRPKGWFGEYLRGSVLVSYLFWPHQNQKLLPCLTEHCAVDYR